MKYRKKSVEVEAVQLADDASNIDEIAAFPGVASVRKVNRLVGLEIDDWQTCIAPGEWLYKAENERTRICTDWAFRAAYEPVE